MIMTEYDFVKMPIVDIVNRIILFASKHKASDIHFDPREDCCMIRMRIDGKLQNHCKVPKMYEKNLATRVKLISKMNITETRVPQDGAIKGIVDGRELDMRVSALPTNEGEKIVIRLLDYSSSLDGIESLGFMPNNLKKIERLLDIPNGIILVTGATGSGKSTTSYAMLSALNKEDTNIITVEDPVEMNIEGINQVHVNAEIGLTFASALRSILRQDPDIILIGEIRDSETAQIAVRAAITGHLVLSTIHTNNALATIERLLDMNVERYLLATALNGIISQKLARTLCVDCKKKRPTTDYEKKIFKTMLDMDVKEVYEPVGCPKCNRGFRGRTALHEVLYITDRLREMISDENMDKEELKQEVYSGDTTTLLQDALLKVVEGYTTFKEVYKVVDIDFDLERSIRKTVREEEREKAKTEDLELIDGDDGVEVDLNNMIADMDEIREKAKMDVQRKIKKKKALHFDDSNMVVINSYEGDNVEEYKKKLEEEEKKLKEEKSKKKESILTRKIEIKKEEPKKEEPKKEEPKKEEPKKEEKK